MQLNDTLGESDFESTAPRLMIGWVEFHKGFRDFIVKGGEKMGKVTGVLMLSIKTGDGVALLEVSIKNNSNL